MPELTGFQRRTLAAAAERILPSSDGPGARETGTADFVAAALGEERLRGWLPLFARGLDRIEEIAGTLFGKDFSAGGPEQQDEVLRRLLSLPDPGMHYFFNRLVRLCVEGFAGRDGPGWRFLGYPPDDMKGDGCLRPTPARKTP